MMSDAHDAPCTPEPISQELDDLTCSLIDYALDILATSGELSVSLAAADKAGKATLLTFDDDDFEESIEEARARVRAAATGKQPIEGLTGPAVRYATPADEQNFVCSDVAPAGVVELLA